MCKRINVNELSKLLLHVTEDSVRRTAKFYGWEVFGTFKPCNHCATTEARQKNLSKSIEFSSMMPGKRRCVGIGFIKGIRYGNRKIWLLAVDDCVDVCWSEFLECKSDTTKKMIPLIKELQAKYGYTVMYICCDNVGGNLKLEEASQKEGLGIQFEYTAPGTLQQNG